MSMLQYILYAALSILLCMCGYRLGCIIGKCSGELEALLKMLDIYFGGGDDE